MQKTITVVQTANKIYMLDNGIDYINSDGYENEPYNIDTFESVAFLYQSLKGYQDLGYTIIFK